MYVVNKIFNIPKAKKASKIRTIQNESTSLENNENLSEKNIYIDNINPGNPEEIEASILNTDSAEHNRSKELDDFYKYIKFYNKIQDIDKKEDRLVSVDMKV